VGTLRVVRQGEPSGSPESEPDGVVRLSSSLAGTHRYELQTTSETVMLIVMSDKYPMDDELAEALYDYLDRHKHKSETSPRRTG
jgi:hypothetical protein